MNLRRITYIGLIALLAASCAKEQLGEQTLSGTGEKTPLTVTAVVDADTPATKAVDKTFEQNDQLLAYLRHVTWDNDPSHARVLVEADKSPRLVTFTKGSEAMTAYAGDDDITPIGTGVALGLTSGNTQQTSDLTASPALYWDDFSNSSSADKDLRTSGHYLESFYGYCYNGGTPSTDLVPEDGTLGWTVAANQSTSDAFKHSDLLWSAEQRPVKYAHDAGRPGLVLPYTHAMSKVTIEIALNEGFDVYPDGEKVGKAKAFDGHDTTPTLFANCVTTTTAPTYTHSTTVAAGDARKIQMRLADDEETNLKARVYEAVIAPTVMKNGNLLAQVTVDGNKYDINLTNEVLTTVPADATYAWSSKLNSYTGTTEISDAKGVYTTENGGITLPGVNYRIKVTLNKQKIDVVAYITNWENVNAAVDGTIMFDADVVSDNATGTAVTATSFDLYRSLTNTDADSYDADGDSDGIQTASTYTYNTDKWVGSPLLYWVNGSTPYYFRALAQVADPADYPNVITSVSGSQAAVQGVDLLWAQTSAHTGTTSTGASVTYAAGAAINPRTGNVPLTFEHAMSKISVLLKTDRDASGAEIPAAAQVLLDGAKISIINLYDGGTIDVKTGNIGYLTSPLDADPTGNPYTIENAEVAEVGSVYGWRNNIVIPQKLDKDKNDVARADSPSYYQSNELTAIYPTANPNYPGTENTSIGTGEATYYLTTELTPVAVELYDETAANTYNGNLPGARLAGYEEKYTAEEAIANNAELDGAVKEGDPKPSPGVYSADEAKQFNAALDGAVAAGQTKPDPEEGTYTEQEAIEHNSKLEGAVEAGDAKPSPGNYTADEAIAYNAKLVGSISTETTKKTYTAEEANAYNAKLPGAVKVGDVKVPAHYKKPDGDITPHNAGELKTAGNKIMLYVTLSDGTRYGIDLATCKDSSDKVIEAWQRGTHYTYTISLAKEQITFRALIKDWDEKTGSGNATLEWD